MTVVTRSEAETRRLGERLGRLLKGLDVVLLTGELGSGKTTFTKGLARGAGFKGRVVSPTFGLARVYRGRKSVIYHLDLYRVAADDTGDIGIEEYVCDPRGLCVVEWPEAGQAYYPADRLEVRLAHARGGKARKIVLSGQGPRSRQVVRALKK